MQGARKLCSDPRLTLLCAAGLFALPFWVGALWPCTFLGAFVLFYSLSLLLEDPTPRRGFALGFVFGFSYHLLVYPWLLALHPMTVAGLDGIVSLLVTMLAYLGACAIHGTFFAVGFWLWRHVARTLSLSRARAYGLFVCLFVTAEFATSFGTLALPWSRIGLPLVNALVLMQSASLFGALFVDAVVLGVGALFAAALSSEARRRILCVCCAVILFCANLAFGLISLRKTPADTIQVAVVQTADDVKQKWANSTAEILRFCRERVEEIPREVSLVVFPETMLNSPVRAGGQVEAYFGDLCEEFDVSLAVGAVYQEAGETYNAVCLFDETGLVSFGAKRHLVPFGEYLPWQDALAVVLPAVADMTYYQSEYTPGKDGLLGETRSATLGAMVCFDTLFGELSADSAREGAELLVVSTNDAWFKKSPAAKQHLWHGAYRAVESGRPLLQSANVGISAVINEHARVLDSVELGEGGTAVAKVSLSRDNTLYLLVGDAFAYLCALSSLAALLFCEWTRLRRCRRGK